MTVQNILVIIPTGDYAERLKLDGVLEYARDKAGSRWNLKLCVGGHVHLPSPETCRVRCDGIIAYVQSEAERRALLRFGLPTVLIEDQSEPGQTPCRAGVATIVCDHVAEGRTAAAYFLSRRFRNFAFIGTERKAPWCELRRQGFTSALRERGLDCAVFSGRADLGAWLKALPKPCAVFAVRDMRAREVLDAADMRGIAVPQEIAVLGVDDDEILCTTARPPLSSIPTFDRSLGYAAGRALYALMTGRSDGGLIRTRHANVVSRQSTETDILGDPFVTKALSWIRAHLDAKINADSLAQAIGYSAPALKSRFARALGTTVGEQVRRMRLQGARDLLTGTALPVEDIALRCGYSCTSHLALRLRQAEGITPLAYRRRHGNLPVREKPGARPCREPRA